MTNCIYCPQDELQNQDNNNEPVAVKPIEVRVEPPEHGCPSDEIDDPIHSGDYFFKVLFNTGSKNTREK